MNKTIEELVKELDNIVFPSKESDGIEHVDMSHAEFFQWFRTALTKAYEAGRVEVRKDTEQMVGAILYSANPHHAVYVNDEALMEKYDIEKRVDQSSLRSVFIANLASLKAKTDE